MDEVGAIGRAHPSHQHWGSRSGEGLGSSRAGGGVFREPRPRDAPQGTNPLGPNFLVAPSVLKIYEGPPSPGIVKHLIENTVKATRQHGLRADVDGHPGVSWHPWSQHSMAGMQWWCQARIPLGGHGLAPGPSLSGICGKGRGPKETSHRCAAYHTGGCSFPELWLGDTHELINS